eukprot:885584-Rhodomonas_salina.2
MGSTLAGIPTPGGNGAVSVSVSVSASLSQAHAHLRVVGIFVLNEAKCIVVLQQHAVRQYHTSHSRCVSQLASTGYRIANASDASRRQHSICQYRTPHSKSVGQ